MELENPPIITQAIAFLVSDEAPDANAIGNIPNIMENIYLNIIFE
jgi:hypothetical protein